MPWRNRATEDMDDDRAAAPLLLVLWTLHDSVPAGSPAPAAGTPEDGQATLGMWIPWSFPRLLTVEHFICGYWVLYMCVFGELKTVLFIPEIKYVTIIFD